MIGSAVVSVGMTVFFSDGVTTAVFGELSFYISLVIFAGAIVMAFRKVHPVLIIVASAIIGIAAGCVLEL